MYKIYDSGKLYISEDYNEDLNTLKSIVEKRYETVPNKCPSLGIKSFHWTYDKTKNRWNYRNNKGRSWEVIIKLT